jgi:RHS repeat-associated protein
LLSNVGVGNLDDPRRHLPGDSIRPWTIEGWSYLQEDDGTVKILLAEPVQTRYLKIHCAYDERDEQNRFLDLATVTNHPGELLKVYYLIDWRSESYAYDPKGNRLHSSLELEDGEEREHAYYPQSDRMRTDGRWGYAYDPNGNLTARGAVYSVQADGSLSFDPLGGEYWEYGYDLLNRLVEVRKADPATGEMSVRAAYIYDAEGLRLKKHSAAQGDTYFLFSVNGALIYREDVEEGRYEEYVYVFDDPLAVAGGQVGEGASQEVVRYTFSDQLGSTVLITDEAGQVLWQDELTPFGESSGSVGVIEELARFTGKELDSETGLYYFNARWYDPQAGRFVTEDPARDGANWYVYVRNNPLKYVDPTGLEGQPEQNLDVSLLEETGWIRQLPLYVFLRSPLCLPPT